MMVNKKVLCIIVVFYKPDTTAKDRFERIGKKFNVVVIDNTPLNEIDYSSPQNVDYISLGNNCGIAYAQNVGIKSAIERGAEYVIFFDQDSVVDELSFSQMVDDFLQLEQQDPNVGAMGLVPLNIAENSLYKTGVSFLDQKSKRVDSLISSSTLVPLRVLKAVGGMWDDLFIDYVDFEWCWRLNHSGYSLYLSNSQPLPHTVGICSYSFLGIHFIVSAPFRYYYRYRNALWLVRVEYVPKRWKVRTLLKMPIETFCVLFFSEYKGCRALVLRNIFRGLKDGVIKYKGAPNCAL